MSNLNYDITLNSRYDDLMEYTRMRSTRAPTQEARKAILKEYGLLDDPSPWTSCFPGLVPFRQFAVDANHTELKGRKQSDT